MDMNSCRGRTPIVKIKATLWSRGSESDGSEIESKNGSDEHHTSGLGVAFTIGSVCSRLSKEHGKTV
jgi:hypothetical protein